VEVLAPLRGKIKKGGRDLRELPAGKRHRLRIRAKRLRYATEFFAATFPGKKSIKRRRKALAALEDLQDALGALNDIAVRAALLAPGEEGAAAQHPALSTGPAEEEKFIKEAERAHARFAKVKPFWKD
jgi:triphosphatase